MLTTHRPHCPVPRAIANGENAVCLCFRTMAELAQEAIQVQDACNLSGVVSAWSRACSELWDNGRAGNIPNFQGTDTINRHPIQLLYVSKVMSLTGTGINQDEFSTAYDECRRLADIAPQTS